MYYSSACSYCGRVFYVYENDKYIASEKLYDIIKAHLEHYDEDNREYKFDDGKVKDSQEILQEMNSSSERPKGGYEK